MEKKKERWRTIIKNFLPKSRIIYGIIKGDAGKDLKSSWLEDVSLAVG